MAYFSFLGHPMNVKRCLSFLVVCIFTFFLALVPTSFFGVNPETGLPTPKFFEHVKLNLVGIEYREPKYGATHGLKASFATEYMQRMTEEQLRAAPWLGNVKPWAISASKHQDDDDLPEANDSNW